MAEGEDDDPGGGVIIDGAMGILDCDVFGHWSWQVKCWKTGIDLEWDLLEKLDWPTLRAAFAQIHEVTPLQFENAIWAVTRLFSDLRLGQSDYSWWESIPNFTQQDQDAIYEAYREQAKYSLSLKGHKRLIASLFGPLEARVQARAVKKSMLKVRRAEFAKARPDLVLAMLNRGDDYICAAPGCYVTTALTVDHIRPIVKGGTDDLDNLQFLCAPCNSSKGASLTMATAGGPMIAST